MLRFAVWLIVLFMIVKIARLFWNWKQNTGPDDKGSEESKIVIPPFDNVQDADFEDITPEPPPGGPEHPPA